MFYSIGKCSSQGYSFCIYVWQRLIIQLRFVLFNTPNTQRLLTSLFLLFISTDTQRDFFFFLFSRTFENLASAPSVKSVKDTYSIRDHKLCILIKWRRSWGEGCMITVGNNHRALSIFPFHAAKLCVSTTQKILQQTFPLRCNIVIVH